MYIKDISFTIKPTSLNINILHPKVSAVPSAQASPGPHAQASPGPLYTQSVLDLVKKITVSTLHTSLYISFVSHVLYGLYVCAHVVFATRYLKSPAVKYKSLRVCFFHQLDNRKRGSTNLQVSILFFSPEFPFS